MKAMVLAAGIGKRLLPFTKDIPKPLIKVWAQTLLDINIKKLFDAGISDIVINTAGLWSDAISKMVGIDSYEIEYYKGDYFNYQSIKNLNCLI